MQDQKLLVKVDDSGREPQVQALRLLKNSLSPDDVADNTLNQFLYLRQVGN